MTEAEKNLLDLQDDIQLLEEQIKTYEDKVVSYSESNEAGRNWVSKSLRSYWQATDPNKPMGTPTNVPTTIDTHTEQEKNNYQNNLTALSEKIELYSHASANKWMDTVPEATVDTEDVSDDPETLSEIAPDFQEQDLLAPFRAQFGDQVDDAQIMNYLKGWKPEIYAQLVPQEEAPPDVTTYKMPKFRDEQTFISKTLAVPTGGLSLLFEPGGGPVTQVTKQFDDFFARKFKYDAPALWSRYTERKFSSPERNEKILRNLLSQDPHMSKQQQEDYINKAKNGNKESLNFSKAIAAEYNRLGRNHSKKVLEEDPDLAAWTNWTGRQGENIFRDKTGKIYLDKYILNMMGSALPSLFEQRVAAGGVSRLASFIPALRAYQSAIGVGTAFVYGSHAMATQSQAETLEYLLTEQPVSEEQIQEEVGNFVSRNYERRDSQLIKKPLSVEEAFDATWWTDLINGVGGGAIETIDRAVGFKLPFDLKKINTVGRMIKVADKTSDAIRKAPIISTWNKLRKIDPASARSKVYFNNTVDVLTGAGQKQWLEAVEEIAQENFMAMNRVYGPGFAEELKYDKGASWEDFWNWKTHIVDPGVAGYAGGKAFNSIKNISNLYLDATGISNKLDDIKTEWQFKRNLSEGYSVRNNGRTNFSIQRSRRCS